MECQIPAREDALPQKNASSSAASTFDNAILGQLVSLSDRDKERVLEFINTLVDAEHRKREFNRLQGCLHYSAR
jgi:hypothetical protein